jgi:hypothetical protein
MVKATSEAVSGLPSVHFMSPRISQKPVVGLA